MECIRLDSVNIELIIWKDQNKPYRNQYIVLLILAFYSMKLKQAIRYWIWTIALCIVVWGWLHVFQIWKVSSQYDYDVSNDLEVLDSLLYRNSQRCERYDRWTMFIGTVWCTELPQMTASEVLWVLAPFVGDVTTEYDALSREFSYTPSKLLFKDWFVDSLQVLQEKFTSDENDDIRLIPKVLIAYDQLDQFKFVASVRDTTIYWPCRKQNYDLAMNMLDGQNLEPQELLNINKLIAYQPGYCTWGWKEYQFYSGVCGWSTQLFWNAILHPWLEVVERRSHGKRYAGFYGSSVMGDDSSIYESAKELIIKNASDTDIAFKTFLRESDTNTVLLSAWRSEHDRVTRIEKEQTGSRSALLRSTITQWDGDVDTQERKSFYYWIDTSIDETANNS